ncbi:hypothetical protein AQJ46_40515 [Streptomyces canus]|uniref:Uncharacterized protein n=1 Tax=Streptomyces canus TaxID=58343 RepID=A0A101RP98_9ACTN|nr:MULTISPECIES: hypothetical protein [Streptomyces]KUN59227.1 hypothetical protein AQJ46_40515 [Streptomyces canus]MDI5907420.1 hypothetical protein [Streptomyces sp. 12257]
MAGKFAVGDTNPGSFGCVYRVDTGEFTLLPVVGGVHSTASDVDRHEGRPRPNPPLPTPSTTPPPGPSAAAERGLDAV